MRYIREAHTQIPEIIELMNHPNRLERLSAIADVALEPYPVSFLSSVITFMGPEDGTVGWHGDSVPVTELVALSTEDAEGGELALYRGEPDEGRALLDGTGELPQEKVFKVRHQVGYSIFGQLMGVLHRTEPMTAGQRVTLNLNLRSVSQPYIEDQRMCHLTAESPDFTWLDQYVDDVRRRQ